MVTFFWFPHIKRFLGLKYAMRINYGFLLFPLKTDNIFQLINHKYIYNNGGKDNPQEMKKHPHKFS